MTFFYDLNKRLSQLADKQDAKQLTESAAIAEKADYSAKKAAAGKDIGKPGKAFAKIAKSAGKEYGSKSAGERVAGAVLNKLRAKESVEEGVIPFDADSNEPSPPFRWGQSHLRPALSKHKETKLIRDLRAQGLSDKQIVRKMEQIKRGTTKTVAKEGDMEEGNAFAKAVIDAKRDGVQPGEKIRVGGKEYPVKEEGGAPMTPKQKSFAKLAPPADKITFADKIAGAKKEVDEMLGDVAAEAIKNAIGKKKEPRSKGTAFDPEVLKTMTATDKHPRYDVKDTGYSKRYTRKVQDEPQDDAEVSTEPKKKGRPKGPEKGPERVTKGSYKFKSGRPAKTKEDLDTDGVMMTRPSNMSSEGVDSEYDQEGESAKCDIKTIVRHAQALHKILGDNDNLPEWVQSKLAKIEGMMTSVDDYMQNQNDETEEQPIAEKAKSKKQQKFMGMVHAAQKGEKPASKEVAKVAKEMPKKAAKEFAATKHKDLPEKVKAKKEESVEETSDAPAEKKAKGGYNFGGSVYESLNKQFTHALNEGMNISVNMNSGEDGQARKSITVSADGAEADQLAELLKMAGMQGQQQEACGTCGSTPCGCESIDENSPDWPTNTETSNNALQYSGGLNRPKSTGQTTTPVIASQLRRQVSMEEGVTLERTLFNTWKNYKAQ
jgi:hypothetical protein